MSNIKTKIDQYIKSTDNEIDKRINLILETANSFSKIMNIKYLKYLENELRLMYKRGARVQMDLCEIIILKNDGDLYGVEFIVEQLRQAYICIEEKETNE